MAPVRVASPERCVADRRDGLGLADGQRVWIMDVLDHHSRVLVAARAVEGPTSMATWDAFSHGALEWGFPARVMSDNGSCFTGRFLSGAEVDFERQLRSMGITQLLSSPSHPQTCGKLERSHQTTKRWLATQPAARDLDELQAQLDAWRDHYNHHRPHRAANGGTPAERWHATAPAEPAGPIAGPRRASLHVVSPQGPLRLAALHHRRRHPPRRPDRPRRRR
jgi:transposase InsO family protein